MINKYKVNRYCCEDLSLIENYDKAVVDSKTWDCHHRKETDEGLSKKQLIEMCLYWHRPACELIFLTNAEHHRLHNKNNKGKPSPLKGRKRPHFSAVRKGKPSPNKGKKCPKYVWLTPDDELIVMSGNVASRCHPDSIRIESVSHQMTPEVLLIY